jgi:hypothetical protein
VRIPAFNDGLRGQLLARSPSVAVHRFQPPPPPPDQQQPRTSHGPALGTAKQLRPLVGSPSQDPDHTRANVCPYPATQRIYAGQGHADGVPPADEEPAGRRSPVLKQSLACRQAASETLRCSHTLPVTVRPRGEYGSSGTPGYWGISTKAPSSRTSPPLRRPGTWGRLAPAQVTEVSIGLAYMRAAAPGRRSNSCDTNAMTLTPHQESQHWVSIRLTKPAYRWPDMRTQRCPSMDFAGAIGPSGKRGVERGQPRPARGLR